MLNHVVGFLLAAFISCSSQAAPFAYITNSGSNTVSVIDAATNTVTSNVTVGAEPYGAAVNPAGTRVYVGNRSSNDVSVIDAATNKVMATISVGVAPTGVAVNPAGTRVYVANSGSNNVSVIDAITNTGIGTVTVGVQPFGVAVNPAGTRVYVSNRGTNDVSVIDTATNSVIAAVTNIGLDPKGVAVNATGSRVYVAVSDVAVINAGTNAKIGTLPVSGPAWAVATNNDNTRVFARTTSNVVTIFTAFGDSTILLDDYVGDGPGGIALTRDGTRLYVVNSGSNSVSVIDLASTLVVKTIPVGERPLSLGQFIGPTSVTPPPAQPDLNQHGLTGSWYEPATNGQGFEIEVFPNMVAAGTGSVQVSWFTFDTVAGGANRQRWYTLSGSMVSGQPTASLTIYQNTGGNFNAPPITNGVQVGTATLSFDTCSSGQLSYNFTDGSGRTGTIPLTRIAQNVTCSATSARPTNADFAFSGNWYDSLTSGQGFTVEVNPNNGSVFVPWYTYAPAGASAGAAGQRWYTASGAFAPGSRSIPVDIFETTGGVFDAPSLPAPTSTKVGSGTLAFQSCSAGTFSYNFTGGSSSGMSGTIALSRIGPVPAGCTH